MYKPFNAITGKAYQGGNIETLTIAAKRLGTSDPRWMTFLQAQEHGWKVSKGSKGTQIAVVREFEVATDENKQQSKTSSTTIKVRRFIKHHVVFNATQIEGICEYGESQNMQTTQKAFNSQLSIRF